MSKEVNKDEQFIEDICDGDEALMQVARELLANHRAPGTIVAYKQGRRILRIFAKRGKICHMIGWGQRRWEGS